MRDDANFQSRCEAFIQDEDRAVECVRGYLTVADDGRPHYRGSLFHGWAGGGDRPAVKDTITADDLVALSLLSMQLPGHVQYELLRDEFVDAAAAVLATIPDGVDLWDATDADLAAARRLIAMVRGIDGAGFVTAFKLAARKRPRLVPVYDNVVEKALKSQHSFFEPMREWLSSEDVRARLKEIAHRGGAPDMHPTRVFDIVVWMTARRGAPEPRPAVAEDD